jgi:predicted secreted hydrolase
LQDQGNRSYGYQLTFFRRGLRGSVERSNDSIWRSGNIYFAHFALTDIVGKEYYSYEKWGRGIEELAGARGNPLNVWIDNWNLKHDNGEFILKASKDNNTAIEFVLVPLKDIVLHGGSGLSAKSSDVGNASYYYSITKLETSGIITKDNITYKVKGSSWFDHEWSTSVLSLNQEGWDWFSIQLHDNSEIMLYQLRLKNGGIDPVSSGTYVSNTGEIQNLGNSDFTIEVLSTWKSVNTKTVYPVKWKVDIPKLSKSFLVEPLLVNQEFNHSFTYWEGAVKVLGKDGTYGSGYVELTGY